MMHIATMQKTSLLLMGLEENYHETKAEMELGRVIP
jgi:hypothetical protein